MWYYIEMFILKKMTTFIILAWPSTRLLWLKPQMAMFSGFARILMCLNVLYITVYPNTAMSLPVCITGLSIVLSASIMTRNAEIPNRQTKVPAYPTKITAEKYDVPYAKAVIHGPILRPPNTKSFIVLTFFL